MISNEKDIFALLQLIDDQDEEVFENIASEIIVLGEKILPHLIFLQETNPLRIIQKRTIELIDRINFENHFNQFDLWVNTEEASIWNALLLINQIVDPFIEKNILEKEFSTLKKNVWLELNDYLTPFEQINVLNKSFYQIAAFQIETISYNNPNNFLISHLLNKKKANGLLMGIFYQIICTELDIPIVLLFEKNEAILCYSNDEHDNLPLFYIDPITGNPYTINENLFLDSFNLSKIDLINANRLRNIKIIQILLKQMALCFDDDIQKKSIFNQMAFLLDQIN